MLLPIDNCAVVAIHVLTGDDPQDIVAGIAAFPNEKGGPAFADDGGVSMASVGRYCEGRGWEVRIRDHQPIPWTCLISVDEPGHAFAILDGFIHDRAGGAYHGAPIIYVMIPPKRRGLPASHEAPDARQ